MVLQESGEMYLETIYILAQKSSYVRSIDVAEYMGFSKPSVSRGMGLLKQGGYNYTYAFVPKGSDKATLQNVEGSHWETENEYQVFVYYRGFGERYDHLLCVTVISSNRK